MTLKETIETTESLEEAVKQIFGLDMCGRLCVLTEEAMTGEVAEQYNALGTCSRMQTYKNIARDFKDSTGCYGINHPDTDMQVGTILDVGCGSGLLTIQLAEQTNGKIIGIDPSEDMIELARVNLQKWEQWKGLKENRIEFIKGSVYDIRSILIDFTDLNYIVCRNVLHRFKSPEKGIEEMYAALAQTGKIYIRDLRRDAPWDIVVQRIGAQRWKHPVLVKDYIGAMAGTLTTTEIESVLKELAITDFIIRKGVYSMEEEVKKFNHTNEHEEDVEYVCVIRKER